MLSRRAFLERGSLALAAMSLHAARAAEGQTGPPTGPFGRPIGLQLYTVREAAAKDLAGTLRAIAGIGYREVELAGIPAKSATELRKILNEMQLPEAMSLLRSRLEKTQSNAEFLLSLDLR